RNQTGRPADYPYKRRRFCVKKWCLFLSLYFCACLLAACASGAPAEESPAGEAPAEPGLVTETFRLVAAGDSGRPAVLAGVDDTSGDVYTLDMFGVEDVTLEGVSREEMALLD